MVASRLIFFAFLALFAIHFAIERVLAALNIKHILEHKDKPPEELKGFLEPGKYAQSIEYALANYRFGVVSAIIDAALTLFFLFSGILPWLDAWVARFGLSEIVHGVVFLMLFGIIVGTAGLPLAIYRTFRIEARFGFNKMDLKTFVVDRVKGFAVSLLIGAPFIFVLLLFITRTGSLWWVWACLFTVLFQFAVMILVPTVIAPLFNKFSPLQDGELKTQLEHLAEKCRFTVQGIFVMDGSKRSTHSNAYFTGLGKFRRIVLFDTLIQQLSVRELAAVLAHEIGHYKRKHIPKMLGISVALTMASFYILSLLLYWPPVYEAYGIQPDGLPAVRLAAIGLLLISLTSGTFSFWLGPLFNKLSRKHEYEADAYAAEQTSDPQSMRGALLKLFQENLGTITPHPAYSAYHYSHPTLMERLAALKQIKV